MFENTEWLFFDVGSTLVDEHFVYEHLFRDVAALTNSDYDTIYHEALEFYRQNKQGDIELGLKYHLPKREWHPEDEILYKDAPFCLEKLSEKYKIGILANQSFGVKNRLEKWGIIPYIDLVIASAEEGVSKPDLKIFAIALQRAKCEPDRAVMIGDRIDNDIVPAKKMGMKTIWLKQGFGSEWKITREEEQPDKIFESLTDLCNYL